MQKRVNWKYVLPVISLSVFLLSIVLLNSSNPSLAPQITTPPPTCATPNTIPATINAPTTLCGTITMTAPTVITSGVIVTCLPGTTINYGGPLNAGFDAIQIAPGVVSAQVNGCTFNGPFLSAIHLMSGVLSSQVNSNIINGAKNGIIEDYLSSNNRYSQNNIQNTGVAMKLEGQQGNTNNNLISNNAIGIFTGIDSATLTSTSPNAICGFGTTVFPTPSSAPQVVIPCSIPQSGNLQRMNSNSITNNVQGIVVFGTDNQIQSNTIDSNQIGIEVNAIYIGSETNPFTNQNQEYFNSGVKITSNTISNNLQVGISMSGRSTYFFQSSQQYHRWTFITQNTIVSNGRPNMLLEGGIVIGGSAMIYPFWWSEYTNIKGNFIKLNNNNGIFLGSRNFMTDIKDNEIKSNLGHGISLGYEDFDAWDRYIYHNQILNNWQYGINVKSGHLNQVYLNEIDYNKKGVYLSSFGYHSFPSTANYVICNDLSYNVQEGFDADLKNTFNFPFYQAQPSVGKLELNRVLENGADGIRYYLDNGSYSSNVMGRTRGNHIEGNGFSPNLGYSMSGYGINSQGFFKHGFVANNFVNNAQGPAYDSGSNTLENMWDEAQFEIYYDQFYCGNCGGSCTASGGCGYALQCVNGMCLPPPSSGLSCDPLTGAARCYANPLALMAGQVWINYFYSIFPYSYVPRGNYGLGNIIPTSTAPPLSPTSCSVIGFNSQCPTYSCEVYPAPINNQQCGNGNFINEPLPFSGYYLPGTVCPNIYIWSPYFGTFSQQPIPIPNPYESINEPPIDLFEEEMYRNLPEEIKNDIMFEQMLLDRRYIEQKNKEAINSNSKDSELA